MRYKGEPKGSPVFLFPTSSNIIQHLSTLFNLEFNQAVIPVSVFFPNGVSVGPNLYFIVVAISEISGCLKSCEERIKFIYFNFSVKFTQNSPFSVFQCPISDKGKEPKTTDISMDFGS